MNTSHEFKEVFAKKLSKTGDFDSAFRKAVWVAYLEGFLAGIEDQRVDAPKVIHQTKQILEKAYK